MPRFRALPRSAPRHEAGSAYLIAIMVMLLLTVIGLSLATVSSTESLIGANERMIQQTLFAADAGLHFAASRLLILDDRSSSERDLIVLNDHADPDDDEPTYGDDPDVRTEFLVDQVNIRLDAPCNLCPNEATEGYGAAEWVRRMFYVVSVGRRAAITNLTDPERVSRPGDDEAVVEQQYAARRTVNTLLDVMPVQGGAGPYEAVEEDAMNTTTDQVTP